MRNSTVLLVFVLFCGANASAQTVWFVDDDAPVGGDGSRWASALRDLQDAIAAAKPGDEICTPGMQSTANAHTLVLVANCGEP